jgi:mRNA-degrading endonuclease RelE of RelBE toxin-antitoxin system
MIRISASDQVAAWLTALPPQTKHRVRLALRDLAEGQGDIRGLQGSLEGFNRLRVGGIRIIYRQISSREIRLDYAQTRDVVSEIFERILENREAAN